MPNTREKMIELLDEATPTPYCNVPDMNCDICEYNHPKWHCHDIRVADHLIANGVTVQTSNPAPEVIADRFIQNDDGKWFHQFRFKLGGKDWGIQKEMPEELVAMAMQCERVSAEHYKPDTNADRIRAMSDEELAHFMAERNVNESTLLLLNENHGLTAVQIEALKHNIYRSLVQWLKQPAEE